MCHNNINYDNKITSTDMSTIKTGNKWREIGNYIALNEKEKQRDIGMHLFYVYKVFYFQHALELCS